jgi:hypothetical protein
MNNDINKFREILSSWKTDQGETALDVAKRQNQTTMVSYLNSVLQNGKTTNGNDEVPERTTSWSLSSQPAVSVQNPWQQQQRSTSFESDNNNKEQDDSSSNNNKRFKRLGVVKTKKRKF